MDTLTLRGPKRGGRLTSSAVLAWTETAALAAATAAGGLALATGYASPLPVGFALSLWAVASVLLTTLLRRRFTSFVVLLAGLPVALAGLVVLAVWLPGAGGDPLTDAFGALPDSGSRLLTSPLPVPVMVDTLVFPALATWLAGAAGTLAWRAGRFTTALLPGALLLLGVVVLNGAAPSAFWAAAVLAGAAAVLLAASTSAAHRTTADTVTGDARFSPVDHGASAPGGTARGLGLAALIGSAVVVLVLATAPVLLSGWRTDPYDPRAALAPRMAPTEELNPLGYLSSWAANPDTPLMTVRSDRVVELRWVALSDFTGNTWLPENGYRASGRILPDPDPVPPHARSEDATVTVDRLPGPWLPVVGVPRRLSAPAAGFDPGAGTAVVLNGEASGLEYQVTGDVADWRPNELAGLRVPKGDGFERYLAVPGNPPPQMEAIVDQATADGTPYEHAVSLARHLRNTYTFDPHAPSGHGYADLRRLLVEPGQQGGGATSEQLASAFAILARQAGIPSRVVIGFDSGAQSPEGEFDVTTGDAIAWGEVYFAGVGWVPFDVTPGGRDKGEDPLESSADNVTGTDPGPAPKDPAEEPHDAADAPEAGRSGVDLTSLVAIGLAAVVVLSIPLLMAARFVRTRRRLAPGRSGDAAVLGAWDELNTGLRLAGVGPPPGATVTELIRVAANAVPNSGGMRRLRFLHRSVNDAGFGPPGRVSGEATQRAVEEVRSFLAELRAGQGRLRRWTWWLDPRPLWWRAP